MALTIGALVAAAARLPILVVGFASSEINAVARRLLRKRWPGLVELEDITKIDDKMIASLAQVFGPLVDLVIVAGGSPCQDLSSLNSSGRGLAGNRSKLFF